MGRGTPISCKETEWKSWYQGCVYHPGFFNQRVPWSLIDKNKGYCHCCWFYTIIMALYCCRHNDLVVGHGEIKLWLSLEAPFLTGFRSARMSYPGCWKRIIINCPAWLYILHYPILTCHLRCTCLYNNGMAIVCTTNNFLIWVKVSFREKNLHLILSMRQKKNQCLEKSERPSG